MRSTQRLAAGGAQRSPDPDALYSTNPIASFRSRKQSDSGATLNEPSKLDEVQVERLDFGQDAVESRAIQNAGEQRVASVQLRSH